MSEIMLNGVVKDTIVTAIKVGAPILIVVLVLGLINKYYSSNYTDSGTDINICT